MSPFRPDSLTTLAGGATALLAGVVLVLAVAAPAARPGLVSVAPADQTTTAAFPSSVTLTFTGEVDPGRSHVTVATSGGVDVASGPTHVDGRQVLRPVRAATPGEYVVAYHVVLAGGEELSGTSEFTVGVATDGGGPGAVGHAHDPGGLATLVPLAVVAVVVIAAVAGYWRGWRRYRHGRAAP